jgi:hypothetical protein
MRRAVALGMLACAGATRIAFAQEVGAHGYVDCRLIARGGERSWPDGGLGKTRFGGGGTEATCVQAGLVLNAQLTPSLLAIAEIQYQTTDRNAFSVLEAYLRWRPVSTTPLRWSIKLGEFLPPISLENDAIGWTSPWTLTPSAINSWIGEEFRTIGAEGRVEWRGTANAFEGYGALFGFNDPAGELLAARGWSLSDLTSGVGSRVREPDVYAIDNGAAVPLRFNPFLENDDRVGWYVGGRWQANGLGAVSILRYDNEADASSHSGGSSPVFSWRTDFWSVCAEADIGDVVVLGQAMTGSTDLAPSPFFSTSTDFRAAYVLAGWNRGSWRPAIRFDTFSTEQLPRDIDARVREHGHAVTVALNWRPREWVRVTGEALHVASTRNQRLEEGIASGQTDDLLQLSLRLLF